MIGKLKGKIENIFEDHCFIDVGGVCYVVHCANNYLKSLNLGKEVSLFIHTMTKDEMPILYGFEEFIEREGYPEGHTQDIWETGVRDGAKWQQERMYSKEDLRTAWMAAKNSSDFNEWFEQYKKK